MTVFCPASMCPLIAQDGSPWTGEKNGACPEHDDLNNKGCPFFSMACGTGGIHHQVDEAYKNEGRSFVIGPNRPKDGIRTSKEYSCPRESDCSWWKHKGDKELCPPRYALKLGLDPRVCSF